jgi:hypothetical protein
MPHSSVWPVSTRVDDRATHIATKTVLYESRCGVSYNFGLSAPCPCYRIRAGLVVQPAIPVSSVSLFPALWLPVVVIVDIIAQESIRGVNKDRVRSRAIQRRKADRVPYLALCWNWMDAEWLKGRRRMNSGEGRDKR